MLHKVEAEINQIVNVFFNDQSSDGSWRYPFEIGIASDCYMIILLRTLEINDEELIKALVERIIGKQERNGSWKLFHDEGEGNVSATVEAYYALLYSGYRNKHDQEMEMARQFIVSKGGITKTHMFTKMMLAITGQYEWPSDFPIPIEVMLLPVSFPVNFFDLSVYGRANLAPILILADHQFSMKTKHSPDLSDLLQERKIAFLKDLNLNEDEEVKWRSILTLIKQGIQTLQGLPEELHLMALRRAEQYMVERIEPDGTFYSYFSSTFLMIFSLLARGYLKNHPVITRAVQGLKSMITQIDGSLHVQYTTATVWNTALISYVLQEAGIPSSAKVIQKANQYLLSRQHYKYGDWAIHNPNTQPGGWGFSNINTINPDVDDSTAALRAIRAFAIEQTSYRQSWDRGINWVISMQNNDGGWPAFEKNVDQQFLTWLPVGGGEDFLIDPSTADLTGRTLQFFGKCTLLNRHHRMIKRGVDWLLHNQKEDGSWHGRWGICYIYGTWAAVTGMSAIGISSDHLAIQKAVKWLHETQNPDGGWGESCKSDIEKQYVPLGVSTRTHTAWALDALIAASTKVTPEIERGVRFLVDIKQPEDWTADYPKGRGMAGAFYIHYHSYEYIWPLLTLAHYKQKFSELV
ncbi:squalene--hopene cyclase [Ectobacillus panaciterrae]|uniref:squalene--hopene cyclase n=1 Tax=Ectobacillus panaciterrae TaxID=363872 RepID=UPI0003F7C3E5|nr:squalene--hopene cyclase [Ectobacillus panaciterrae]